MKAMKTSSIVFYEGYKSKEAPRILIHENCRYNIHIKKRERRMDSSGSGPVDLFACRAGPYSFQVKVFSDREYEIRFV